ncbi:MAG: peptidylprolyl isomerase [archaeon]
MIKKNDFVKLEFIGKVVETGEVFDTTNESEAKKAGIFNENEKSKFNPLKICVGMGMLVSGFDKALEEKELNKDYEIELNPQEAFGKRDSKLVRTMSVSAFRQRGIDPITGMMLSLDNFLVRIASVSSGRAIVDFNNPLSGKHILYKFKILENITDMSEKISILCKVLVGFEGKIIEEKGKYSLEFDFKMPPKIEEELKRKIKEILKIEIEVIESKKEEQANN